MQFKDQHKKKAITLSYDDGTTQDIQLIELLNKYGLKATFNLNSQRLGVNKILIREGKRVSHYKIHPSDVRYVYEGHEIAAHTLDHPLLPKLDDAEVVRQVVHVFSSRLCFPPASLPPPHHTPLGHHRALS